MHVLKCAGLLVDVSMFGGVSTTLSTSSTVFALESQLFQWLLPNILPTKRSRNYKKTSVTKAEKKGDENNQLRHQNNMQDWLSNEFFSNSSHVQIIPSLCTQ